MVQITEKLLKKILESHAPIKAIYICNVIKKEFGPTDKKKVNSTLYKMQAKGTAQKNEKYEWSFAGNTERDKESKSEQKAPEIDLSTDQKKLVNMDIINNASKDKLVDLIDYVGQLVKLNEKPVAKLEDYRQLLYHEINLKDQIGIAYNTDDKSGPVWMKIDRLQREDPPLVPDEIKKWITVGRDPFQEPQIQENIVETLPRCDVDHLVQNNHVNPKDIQPVLKEDGDAPLWDVILRLNRLPDIQVKTEAYSHGAWARWSTIEKSRRHTINIYENFGSGLNWLFMDI